MIHLVRHGETAWSRTRQHTGVTDLSLTDEGIRQVHELAPLLAPIGPVTVFTSPLTRARQTCELTGLGGDAIVDERLREWDYGSAEGRTTAEIREEIPGWSVWTHPLSDGETVEEVGARADAVIDDLRSIDEPVILFGHAHLFRVLAARWCGLPPVDGRRFMLEPASLSTLGYERETSCVVRWNVTPGPALDER